MSGQPTINEWADMMPQMVTIEPWVARTGGGSGSSYGTPFSLPCRIEIGNHLVVDRSGRTVTARGKVFLLSSTIINIEDRVTLPTGYVPTQPPLIDVNVADDEDGNHHITLEFQ